MSNLITLYQDLINRLNRLDWLVPTLARLTFLMVLFFYFWNSALLKIDGSIFSPSAGAFGQIFPKAAEAVVWDVSQMTLFQRLVIFAGTVAEFILPVLIVVGLLTRLAAVGMIGFVAVQTIVDVLGHGVALGALFDSGQALIDQRMLWVFLFVILVLKGAGPLSIDALAKRLLPA
ncbi:MAG: DoxX family protein [Shimia sp.]|uniref:DoxX family protein n=1 Tax=Shimia sp. TaxID=1954381 RepID=UPI001B0C0EA7|nr:DoxX family protein [Shimia sp.]MBO6896367.1 DoxX family protein [Shimia sp.]